MSDSPPSRASPLVSITPDSPSKKRSENTSKPRLCVDDQGTSSEESVDYPDYGRAVGESVASKKADLGIAICGSGIGISIAANKVPRHSRRLGP